MTKNPKPPLTIETLTHDEATRKNIPTAEYQAVMRQDEQQPVQVEHPRQATGLEDEKRSRNRDLDPQLIWRGKDRQDSAILNMKFVGLPDLSGQIFEQFLGALPQLLLRVRS